MTRTLVGLGLALLAACGPKAAAPAAQPEPVANTGTQRAGDLPPPPSGASGEMYTVHPGLDVAVEWVACERSDCVAIETKCCDYCSGGAIIGVNAEHAEDLRPYVERISCTCTARKEPCPPVDQIEIACMTGVCIPVTPDVSGEWK